MAVSEIELHDNHIVRDTFTYALPNAVSCTFSGKLPARTTARQNYFMILPLLAINIFQANHKLTLGESSFKLSPAETFRRELGTVIENERFGSEDSVNIDVREVECSGIFASGFILSLRAADELALCKNIKARIRISLTIRHKDSTLVQRRLTFLVSSGEFGRAKLSLIDESTGAIVKTKLLEILTGDSFDQLMPLTIEAYEICSRQVAREVLRRIRDALSDYHQYNSIE